MELSQLYPNTNNRDLSFELQSPEAFLSMKWGSFTAKASEVASKARGALNDIVTSSNNGTLEGSDANLGMNFQPI